jgi:site-specific DNA-cytosine methylase
VLDGSPPCASFSTADKYEKHWSKVKKYSDKQQIFFEYVRFLRLMRPKVFRRGEPLRPREGSSEGYFIEILAAMKGCGYRVEARLLDACYYYRLSIILVKINKRESSMAFPNSWAARLHRRLRRSDHHGRR